jgi:hypothetical protein
MHFVFRNVVTMTAQYLKTCLQTLHKAGHISNKQINLAVDRCGAGAGSLTVTGVQETQRVTTQGSRRYGHKTLRNSTKAKHGTST